MLKLFTRNMKLVIKYIDWLSYDTEHVNYINAIMPKKRFFHFYLISFLSTLPIKSLLHLQGITIVCLRSEHVCDYSHLSTPPFLFNFSCSLTNKFQLEMISIWLRLYSYSIYSVYSVCVWFIAQPNGKMAKWRFNRLKAGLIKFAFESCSRRTVNH